ncbi:DUF4114 domain-containing protein [Desulfobacterales bacterium HSG2]|nr:DUF4114 domain-containing protein [Desulfobacterales bacterium HSG2]
MITIKLKRTALWATMTVAIFSMFFFSGTHFALAGGCALEINSTLTSEADDEIWVDVAVYDVENLDTYRVDVTFDPERMTFLEGHEDNPSAGILNLLKQRGGTTAGFLALEKVQGTVTILNALVGINSAEAPEGSGTIALLKFRLLDDAPDNSLTISKVTFLNPGGTDDPVPDTNIKPLALNPTFKIEGYAKDRNDSPLEEVTVQIVGASELTTYSDDNGYYQFTGISEGSYTVSVTKEGYEFQPLSENVLLDSDNPVATIDFNEKFIDKDNDGLEDDWEIQYFGDISRDGTGDYDGDGYTDRDEFSNGTDPAQNETSTVEGGVFTADKSGVIEIDWLYDGGMYEGELGIFSLDGMFDLITDRTAFIKESTRRVLSNSTEGYVVLSDSQEGARFSGSLGEPTDWNRGPYVGAKSFQFKSADAQDSDEEDAQNSDEEDAQDSDEDAQETDDGQEGTQFAIALVPNSTFEQLSQNPETTVPGKRPLFSLVLSNPFQGTHLGQVADINGSGNVFVFEDMEVTGSDKDYNDLIIRVTGATVDVEPVDTVANQNWHDWRQETDLGAQIIEHAETPPIQSQDMSVSVTFDTLTDALMVYDSQDRVCGKEGCYIPGAKFEIDDNGHQHVYLPKVPDDGESSYRLMLRGTMSETRQLTVKGHQGDTEISSDTKEAVMEAHKIFTSDLTASSSDDSLTIDFGDLKEHTASDGETPLCYDFDLDGDIDDGDVKNVLSRMGASAGDQDYDPVYDLDDDGSIGLLDLMTIRNSKFTDVPPPEE